MPTNQICKTCKQDKPADAFFKQKTKRSGLFAECRMCSRVRNQNWIDSNRDRFRHLNRDATNAKRRRDPITNMLALARARCRRSGVEFSLTASDLTIPEFCPVLGIKLTYGLGKGEGNSLAVRDTRASLDRIDNKRGYVPGNVAVVSYRANRIKSDADVSELLKIARFYAALRTEEGGQAGLSGVFSHEKEET